MSQPGSSPSPRIPLRALLALGLGGAGILWLLLNLYTSPASRECIALYRAARTAADTLTVDQTLPPSAQQNAQPRTCGFVRVHARWQ
jgi:hypothetical protein